MAKKTTSKTAASKKTGSHKDLASLKNRIEKMHPHEVKAKLATAKSKEHYLSEIFKSHEHKHFFDRPVDLKAAKDKKKLEEKEASKILKEAMNLAKAVVGSKDDKAKSELERLFSAEEEFTPDTSPSKEIDAERAQLEKERESSEIHASKIQTRSYRN